MPAGTTTLQKAIPRDCAIALTGRAIALDSLAVDQQAVSLETCTSAS